MSNVDIDSRDVLKLILQFLKENNMTQSLQTLQTESNVSLNTVENLENFLSDIHNGKWESVLSQVSLMQLPQEKLIAIYEQVVIELLEARDNELAREILRTTHPMQLLKKENPERYLKLEHLCQKTNINQSDAYEMGTNKEKRRQEIAESLVCEVIVVPPSRLLALIGQSLKYQQSQGLLNKGQSYDLFKGGKRTFRKENEEKLPKKQSGQIKFDPTSHPETILFPPDGQSLMTGSIDGFIEIWDHDSCRLRKDLDYQAKEELMMHEDPVLCSSFTRDSEYLATGSKDGNVKIWKISNGSCVRKISKAHSQGITSVTFSKDGSQVLTTSFDGNARIHGLKSGKTLKDFRGHCSFVNCACFNKDSSLVFTGSSDGSIRVWDVRTTECLLVYRPGIASGTTGKEISIHTIQMMPNNLDHILVVAKSPHVFIITTQGQLVKTFSSGKQSGGDFLCATVSPQGKWIYCVGEDGVLYMFDSISGELESFLQIADSEVIGIVHHPHRNLICTTTVDGQLKLWKP